MLVRCCSLAGASPRRPERRGCPAQPRLAASRVARRACAPLARSNAANAGKPAGGVKVLLLYPRTEFRNGIKRAEDPFRKGSSSYNAYGVSDWSNLVPLGSVIWILTPCWMTIPV